MTLSDQQRLLVSEAYSAYLRSQPTLVQKAYSKTVLQDPEAPATAVFIAAKHLLGPTFVSYEPETLWLELDPCVANRDKLGAAIALAMTPSFYWDYRVFGATVHAFSNEMVIPEAVPRCDAGPMAWAEFEAELLFAVTDGESTRPEYDESVAAYVACCLFEEGFVTPPTGLGFAAEELKTKISQDAQILRTEVENAWSALPKEKLEQTKFEDNPVGAQLRKLVDSWMFVEAKTKLLRQSLEKL